MQELTQEQFSEWLDDPVTEIFLKYLKDSINEEAELVAERIKGGGTMSDIEQTRIGTTCVTLEQIAEIELSEIIEFYKED